MNISPAIANAHCLEEVVSIINDANSDKSIPYFGGTEVRDGDTLAGHYAYDAFSESDSFEEFEDSKEFDPYFLDGHLDILVESGAEFDREKALKVAIEFAQFQKESMIRSEIFGRTNQSGNVDILWLENGEAVNRIDEALPTVYPIGSSVSAHHEHPNGIELTQEDAQKLGIEIEQHQQISDETSSDPAIN